jgi:hypothetical protein
MKHHLFQILQQAGQEPCEHCNPDGSSVLILPHGGRLLGLFPPESDENFYWTHAALESAASTAKFYAGPQWHNSGGERTWLAPEVDFFFPDFPRLDRYWQPRQLDPGSWQLSFEQGRPRLVNRLSCVLARSKAEVDLEISKTIGPAPDPLRRAGDRPADCPAEYAGYAQTTSLWVLAVRGPDRVRVGLWNLIQMPHGGELLAPTYRRTEPRIIFGPVPAAELWSSDRLFRWRMCASGERKISLRAAGLCGRIGYCRPRGDGRWDLVVRNILVNPSGHYVDAPWDAVDDEGYAVQACSVDCDLGRFNELEYHVPAVESAQVPAACEDVSQVWAYRGTAAQIESVVHCLLTPDPLVRNHES